MARDPKPTNPLARPVAGVEVTNTGDVSLITVVGQVDEQFAGFGGFEASVKAAVVNVAGMTRMTSFGVRQWLKGMEALPKTISDLYLLGCPTFFVDQLNMVLNFGGVGQVLTVVAPYTCPACGAESGEMIDVLAHRATLVKGGIPEKECARCGGKLEFDETPESYFSFVPKYAATSIQPAAAQVLATSSLYYAVDVGTEKPPRIIKLVHGSVTYFRIIGRIGQMFRARPFLVGAEGEVVIDLAELEEFDSAGQREWQRLLKTLGTQVPAVTLVDVTDSFLRLAGQTISAGKNISVWSVLFPYKCVECGKVSSTSQRVSDMGWPPRFASHVCPTCGGATKSELSIEVLAPLQKASTSTPPASEKLIAQRQEVLSRALTDANVAQAGENATQNLAADDTILGKYKIVRRLSAGGMAEVFLAKQIGIGGFEKPVALKRIQRQLLESRHLAIDMFLNEAKIAGRLMHPNIVQVLDVGELKGALYLAMEYVRGKDLRELGKKMRASRTSMPLTDAVYIVKEVAQALHHAYWSTDMAGKQLNVVHRDVSPHNIILGYDGTVKLLDFGVAMSAVTEHAETMIVGKWQYMSPEHTTQQQVDHRSDLFSLGVIFYLLVTNQMPFSGSDPREIVRKTRAGQYKPLQQFAPDAPPGIAQLVARLLSPNPDDRPQTGQEVVASLGEIMRGNDTEGSSASIARFLVAMFPDDIGDSQQRGILEIVKFKQPDDVEGAQTQKVAIGSGPTQSQGEGSHSLSPGSGSLSPGSSLQPRGSASSSVPVAALDASVSLPRPKTSSPMIATPPPELMRPTNWTGWIIAALVILAVAVYLIVRPT